MLGANAIGKTTTTNMIIFGFVGEFTFIDENTKVKVDSNYFADRVQHIPENPKKQLIILKFRVNDKEIEIHRNLRTGTIDKFFVNGIDGISASEYPDFMVKHTAVSMDDLKYLLQFMLIRINKGNYILWDKEAQTNIIALLLNDVVFQKEIAAMEDKYKNLNDKCTKASAVLKNEEKRKDDLIKRKAADAKKLPQDVSIAQLNQKVEICKLDIEKIEKEIGVYKGNLSSEKAKGDAIFDAYKVNASSFRLAEHKLTQTEIGIKKLKAHLINHQIDCTCILCKQVISEEKAKQIHQQFYIDKICPVCDNSVGEPIDLNDQEGIKQRIESSEIVLLDLKKDLITAKKEYELAEKEYNAYEKEMANLRRTIENKINKLFSVKIELFDLAMQIDDLKMDKPIDVNYYDLLITQTDIEISKFLTDLNGKERARNKYKEEVIAQRRERNNIINSFHEDLKGIFNQYAQKYLNTRYELVLPDAKPDAKPCLLQTFTPAFVGITRNGGVKVSQSEAIFLECIFRVSLLELYFGKTNTKPFLFLETSEGDFDTAYTPSIAKMFSKFAADKFPVILAANRSKEDFMKPLFISNEERKNRTFDLIQYGRLSEIQQLGLFDYE